ncbi:NACHT domain-containing protein [Corynascus similis CBS 632.67]
MADDSSSEPPQKRVCLHTSIDLAASQEAPDCCPADSSSATRGSPSIPVTAAFRQVQGRNVIAGQNISGGMVNINFHGESEDKNNKYLKDLRTTDPRHDKTRIEQTKGGLLVDSYRWILDNNDFQRWRDDGQSRLLWIKGDPGKGKTMLLCGILNELQSASDSNLLSFFFCQATDTSINNATAILRGLIYLLVDQQPSLLSHVQKKYDATGNPLFRGVNTWVALSEIFTNILEDPTLPPTRLIIDALDECIEGLDLLLGLIVQTSSIYTNVKWIVSSRNWPIIEKKLDATTQKIRLSLELNEESQNGYDIDTRDAVERYLSTNAHGTFLWVALVCQELADISGWEAEELLELFPSGLDALYRRMMAQIHSSRHAKLVRRILATIAVVYRPITLEELPTLVDTPCRASGNDRALIEIIGLCGSFLALRGRTMSFVHQSAKDFLLNQAHNEIFPSGTEHIHYTVFSRSLLAMQKTLRRDIYKLGAPGFSIDKVIPPNPDRLAALRYSCVYWVNHLRDCHPKEKANKDLQNGGSIDTFLREKYLYWLEALSLSRCLSEGVASMLELQRLLESEKETAHFIDRVRDACRFSLSHKWGIENSPLQVYTSALIFSPACSTTRNQYGNEEPEWIIQKPAMADNWSSCLQTLEGHSHFVRSVAWSHDSTRLASASYDRTVKIWDPTTGQLPGSHIKERT